MTGNTRERRSPDATAHDPPVTKLAWTVEQDIEAAAFLEDARSRGGWNDTSWERLLRHGGLHVNRARYDVEQPPVIVTAGASVVAYAFESEPRETLLDPDCVLADEGGLVVVNKPPYFTVQGTRASRLCSLERALRRLLDAPSLTPIHRLDRETSGVLLFARDSSTASEIGRQFGRRRVHKEYLAVVSPEPSEGAWTVEGEMVRVTHPSHSLFALRPAGSGGAPSLTRFETVSKRGDRALVRAFPVTGRTHQLRVHLASGGTPIAGDSLYGTGWMPGSPGSARRLLLHACRIAVTHGGRDVAFEAATPADMLE